MEEPEGLSGIFAALGSPKISRISVDLEEETDDQPTSATPPPIPMKEEAATSDSKERDAEKLNSGSQPAVRTWEVRRQGGASSPDGSSVVRVRRRVRVESGGKGEGVETSFDEESLGARTAPPLSPSELSQVLTMSEVVVNVGSEVVDGSVTADASAEAKEEAETNGMGEQKKNVHPYHEVRALFDTADTDKSGLLELGEVRALFKFANVSNLIPGFNPTNAFEEMDSDGDGKVNREELLCYCSNNPKIGCLLMRMVEQPTQKEKEEAAHRNLLKQFSSGALCDEEFVEAVPQRLFMANVGPSADLVLSTKQDEQCAEAQGKEMGGSSRRSKLSIMRQVSAGSIVNVGLEHISKASVAKLNRQELRVVMLDGTEFVLPGKWTEKDTITKVKASVERERGVRPEAQILFSEENPGDPLADKMALKGLALWHLLLMIDEDGAELELAKSAEARERALAATRARHETMVAVATAPAKLLCMLIWYGLQACFHFGTATAAIVIATKYGGMYCEKELAKPLLGIGILGVFKSTALLYASHVNRNRNVEHDPDNTRAC
jgi:Ca2+-binding EF-hand superfamily protein